MEESRTRRSGLIPVRVEFESTFDRHVSHLSLRRSPGPVGLHPATNVVKHGPLRNAAALEPSFAPVEAQAALQNGAQRELQRTLQFLLPDGPCQGATLILVFRTRSTPLMPGGARESVDPCQPFDGGFLTPRPKRVVSQSFRGLLRSEEDGQVES